MEQTALQGASIFPMGDMASFYGVKKHNSLPLPCNKFVYGLRKEPWSVTAHSLHQQLLKPLASAKAVRNS